MDWNTTEYTFFMIMYMFVCYIIFELFKEVKSVIIWSVHNDDGYTEKY